MTENPDVSINGWRKCGLLRPFDESTKDEVLQNAKAAASTPGSGFYPLFPEKPAPEGSEPEPETVEPFLSEEEVCVDASQAVEAARVLEQTQAERLAAEAAAAKSAAPVQAKAAWANIVAKTQLTGGSRA